MTLIRLVARTSIKAHGIDVEPGEVFMCAPVIAAIVLHSLQAETPRVEFIKQQEPVVRSRRRRREPSAEPA